MAVPWLQIVGLVPSILEVSRELLKRTKRTAEAPTRLSVQSDESLVARIAALEENEQRQAELIARMAEQHSVLANAVTSLHRSLVRVTITTGIAIVIALTAVAIAVWH